MSAAALAIADLPTFLAHALAIEEEAVLRYRDLSAQMAAHNNLATAALFQKLAAAETAHAAEIYQRAKGMMLPSIAPWDYRWRDPESPESVPYAGAHYRMTPRHALLMALEAEKRARDFFEGVAAEGVAAIAPLAREFAAEEVEHVARVEAALARAANPLEDWELDYDAPVSL